MPYINYSECLQNLSTDAIIGYLYLISGVPLSQIYSGRTYIRVRNELISKGYASLTTVPGTRIRRLLPLGTYVEFDIYSKQHYEYKRDQYTFQVRFRIWFPKCYPTEPKRLLGLFLPLAYDFTDRINYGVHIEATELPFTIGIHRVTDNALVHNNDVTSVLVTKYTATRVIIYRYDFHIRYRWLPIYTSLDSVYVDMCQLYILRAISCRTGIDLYQNYNARFTEITGSPYNEELYRYILNKCDFRWTIYIPTSVTLCG